MCLRDEEMANHLLIHCNFVCSVWVALLGRFDMHWVMPWSVAEHFQQWFFRCQFVRCRILWKFMVYATFWKLWLEKNNRISNNKSQSVEEIVDNIVRIVPEWASKRDQFEGIFLKDITTSWTAILDGGGWATSARKSYWMPPPHGIIKLNIDGSHQHSIRRGGIGGAIRDSSASFW